MLAIKLFYNTPMRVRRFSAMVIYLLTPVVILATVWFTQLDQDGVALASQQARLAQARNQPAEAADALQKIVDRQPWRVGLYEQIGSLANQAEDLTLALDAYEKALHYGVLSPDGQMILAELSIRTGNLTQGRSLLLDLVKSGEMRISDYEKAVTLIEKAGDSTDCLAILDAWLKADPQSARAQYLNGVYLALLQPARAVILLSQAALDEEFQSASSVLLDALDLASSLSDESMQALEIGRGLMEIHEWIAAEAAFEHAVSLQPDLAEGWAFLAEVRQELGKPAVEQIERALELAPESPTVQALAAIYWRRLGKPELSMVYLHAAASQEPENAFWQLELGRTLCELNNLQDALPHFVRATELEPKNALTWIELARFSLNYNIEPARIGIPAARKAILLAPKDAAALDVMGALLFTQNDLASAERFLQQSLELNAASAEANLHLGQVYLAAGNPQAARPYLDAVVRLSPETSVGRLAERLIQQNYP